jgi:quercetin dioxygenase-like cupin family protein
MAGLETKSLDSPDETRPFEKGKAELVTLGGVTVGRGVLEPGWRWSEHVKPIAGTDSCQVTHTGYVISGRLKVVMDDGSEGEAGPGDAYVIPAGHDAWVVGDQTFILRGLLRRHGRLRQADLRRLPDGGSLGQAASVSSGSQVHHNDVAAPLASNGRVVRRPAG